LAAIVQEAQEIVTDALTCLIQLFRTGGALMGGDSHSNLPPFPPAYRASGLLLHITSLPSPYGIGDVDPLRSPGSINFPKPNKAGGRRCLWARRLWQLSLSSLSSFAGTAVSSADWLIEDGLLAE